MILDSFYLLFKAQGTKEASADILDLEKRVDELAKKGTKATNEEVVHHAQLKKILQEKISGMKDLRSETDKLGESFTRLVEGTVGALTAYLSLQGIKSGVLQAEDLNNKLSIQAKLTGQNAGELRGYAQALRAAGGDAQGLLSFVTRQQQAAAGQFIKLPPIGDVVDRLRALTEGKDITEKTTILQAANAIELAPLVEESKIDWEEDKKNIKEHAKYTNEAAEASRNFDRAWSETRATLTDVFSAIDTDLLPALTSLAHGLTDVLKYLRDHKQIAEALAVILPVLTTLIGVNMVAALTRMGLAATFAAGPWGVLLATMVAVFELIKNHQGVADWLFREMDSASGDASPESILRNQITNAKRSGSKVGTSDLEKQAYDFWLSQGYNPGQAAVLVGNQRGEGWTSNASVGDNGTAFGIAQWHSNRMKAIKDATGIDVRTAPFSDQLRAQAWEMRNLYGITPDTLPSGTAAGTAYLVNNYEFTGNRTLDAMKRGQYAAEIAQQQLASTSTALPWLVNNNSSVGGSRSTSVKVDNVNVQTQATDAQGIAQAIGPALRNELRTATSNWDDGVGM